jgi:hypothetical protein
MVLLIRLLRDRVVAERSAVPVFLGGTRRFT